MRTRHNHKSVFIFFPPSRFLIVILTFSQAADQLTEKTRQLAEQGDREAQL